MAHGGCGRATAEDMNLEWFHRVGMVNGSFSSWIGLGGAGFLGQTRPGSCLAQRVVSLRELSRSVSYGREQVQGRSS